MTITREVESLNRRLAVLGMDLAIASVQTKVSERIAAAGDPDDEVVGVLDFTVEGKAMPALDGGLTIEGQAGGEALDRSGEAFLPGVLAKGLERYLKNPILCYHHNTAAALGVVEGAQVDGAGRLHIRARLDEPEPGTPLADVFRKVASGTIRGLSVGGIFKRRMTPEGPRIYDAEIVEISVTPVPMEPGSLFTLSGKAVSSESNVARLAKLTELVDTLGEAAAKI
jgi:phage head maturation protease